MIRFEGQREAIIAAAIAFAAWTWITGLLAACYWIEPWLPGTVQVVLFFWGSTMPVMVIGAVAVVRSKP